ncbi:hypothetical protein [Streptomyces sp. NPDC088752]|uniref:hypothetical protein n=1 Tax=Streptomyces sp. NPDC088752 TaxID=3154963 RepID=UPI003412A0A6
MATGALIGVATLVSALGARGDMSWGMAVLMFLSASVMLIRGVQTTLPEPLGRVVWHVQAPAWICGLTVCQAVVRFSASFPAVVWCVAATATVYGQRQQARALTAWAASQARTFRASEVLLVGGALVCGASLFLRWGSSGYFLGGFQNNHMRDRTFDGFTSEYTDRWEFGFNMMTNWVDVPVDGRDRPLAALVLLAVGMLLLAARSLSSGPVRAWTVLLPAATVSVWGLSGVSGEVGPWVFLAGAAAMDVAVVRTILHLRGSRT